MTRRHFFGLTAVGSAVALGEKNGNEMRPIGPVTALVKGFDALLASSAAGVLMGTPADPNQWTHRIVDPAWRVLSMAWGEGVLYLAGGSPGRSGMLGRARPVAHADDSWPWSMEERRIGDDLVYGIAAHPSGQALAAACHDGRILLLKTKDFDGSTKVIWQKHQGIAQAVAYSADGRWLASAGLDGAVFVGRAGEEEKPLRLQDHTSGVTCLAFSPDGNTIASGSRDAKVRLHTTAGRLIRTYSGFRADEESANSPGPSPAAITCLAWWPQGAGRTLWAGSAEGAVFELSPQQSDWRLRYQTAHPVLALERVEDRPFAVAGDRLHALPAD